MAETPNVVISFKDIVAEDDEFALELEEVKAYTDKRCRLLAEEFPEANRFEVTTIPDGVGYSAHAHVTGKNTEAATRASASELRPVADLVLDKLERQLRRMHDKRIFLQRRGAMQANPKRG